MNNNFSFVLFSLLITGCENSDAIKPVTHLKDGKDSSSYALGADLGENLKKQYGLQYRVIREGTGKSPTSMDQVQVNYEGHLLDGTVFDSSYEKDEPAVFRLNGVIKGWIEGLQLMKVGAEFEFFIHPKLGFGQRGNQNVPPNSALIFKVELLKVFEKNMK